MRKKLLALAAGLVLFAAPAIVSGQVSDRFDLSWAHLPGGGGTSSGDSYTVTGAVGQPVGGTAVGGNYTVASGFFSGGPVRYRLFAPGVAASQ